jgi:hypothetical protein
MPGIGSSNSLEQLNAANRPYLTRSRYPLVDTEVRHRSAYCTARRACRRRRSRRRMALHTTIADGSRKPNPSSAQKKHCEQVRAGTPMRSD